MLAAAQGMGPGGGGGPAQVSEPCVLSTLQKEPAVTGSESGQMIGDKNKREAVNTGEDLRRSEPHHSAGIGTSSLVLKTS